MRKHFVIVTCIFLCLQSSSQTYLSIVDSVFDYYPELNIDTHYEIKRCKFPFSRFGQGLVIDSLRQREITIENNKFKTNNYGHNNQVSVTESILDEVNIRFNDFLNARLFFYADTFDRELVLEQNSSRNKQPGKAEYIFTASLFNHDVYISQHDSSIVNVSFSRCRFSAGTYTVIDADTVEFFNCDISPNSEFHFFPARKGHKVYLKIKSTAIENLNFTYTEDCRLIFDEFAYTDSLYEPDFIARTYGMLIAKYEREHLLTSWQNAGVDFGNLQYEHSKNLFYKITNRINYYWWGYEYEKYKVIYWTIGFIVAFFVLNFVFWKWVKDVYTIIPEDISKRKPQDSWYQYHKRLVPNIILFTLLIFFSLRIDFDKFNYHRPVSVILLLIQYVAGLVCLFFMINAVIKI